MTHHRSTGFLARAAAALTGAALLQGATAAPPAGPQNGPFSDPTRPPAALSAPGGLAAAALPHQANRDTARAIAAAQRAADPPPPPAPVLVQAVQLPTSGAALALVDGRLVKVGEQIDGRAVLAIDAQGLLVKGLRGPERLWLLGGAPKQAAGSITQGQTARYQAAPQPGPQAANQAANQAPSVTADPGGTQVSPPNTTTGSGPAANPAPGQPANTGAAATPLSLARRTAP